MTATRAPHGALTTITALEAHMEHTDTEALFAEIDAALAAYGASIDRGLALAAEMHQLADTVDAGMADARAEFDEWW